MYRQIRARRRKRHYDQGYSAGKCWAADKLQDLTPDELEQWLRTRQMSRSDCPVRDSGFDAGVAKQVNKASKALPHGSDLRRS